MDVGDGPKIPSIPLLLRLFQDAAEPPLLRRIFTSIWLQQVAGDLFVHGAQSTRTEQTSVLCRLATRSIIALRHDLVLLPLEEVAQVLPQLFDLILLLIHLVN